MNTSSAKTALIFGISGQDGGYLTRLLLEKGYDVHGTSRDAETSAFANLVALGLRDKVTVHSAALTDFRSVLQTVVKVEPDEIYNLSGQSSVGLSFQQPVETLESIATATLNVLEVLRFLSKPIRFYNAGSSECFGNTGDEPANETSPFHPRSPYAVAKSTAFWEVANYRESYGLFACSGILFNHESPMRPSRFVTRKIAAAAARIARDGGGEVSLGDLSVRRDWGWAPEYVEAMWAMLQHAEPEDLVIATGEVNPLSEFAAAAFSAFDLDWRDHVKSDPSLLRPSEIRCGFGCAARAKDKLGWTARTRMREVARRMALAERARLDGLPVDEWLF
ncbi:GDP-D-mannose dehydratase, NAD(P)-binding [uncultured Alphaproteobacteria bacterium]|uniref:GDP-mannose 4,6-dehydratase n=1 Tax=uncultured Alphaproteobacteria bacterium TaxID=91750 RepID=A0A212KD48_9PROT|nr:GDP-D-mannose dehydratase, NAD(P)-binding [uncultured Alphaproteobacteria bacterium]